jgi:hypothetical protein
MCDDTTGAVVSWVKSTTQAGSLKASGLFRVAASPDISDEVLLYPLDAGGLVEIGPLGRFGRAYPPTALLLIKPV